MVYQVVGSWSPFLVIRKEGADIIAQYYFPFQWCRHGNIVLGVQIPIGFSPLLTFWTWFASSNLRCPVVIVMGLFLCSLYPGGGGQTLNDWANSVCLKASAHSTHKFPRPTPHHVNYYPCVESECLILLLHTAHCTYFSPSHPDFSFPPFQRKRTQNNTPNNNRDDKRINTSTQQIDLPFPIDITQLSSP